VTARLSPEDRRELSDLVLRYATAVDNRDWDLLETCFAADATALYGQLELGDREAIVEHLRTAVAEVDAIQHFVTNQQVRVEGDEVTSDSYLYAYHGWRGEQPHDYFIRGGYRDRMKRTPEGWRIVYRHRLEATWDRGDRSHLGGRAAHSN
jgi:3-phenylpropionate/cinnamic acid dioxygenase small subunit